LVTIYKVDRLPYKTVITFTSPPELFPSVVGPDQVKERKERKKEKAKVDTFQNIKHLPLSLTLTANTILIGNSLLHSFKE
jgi:hypothetical protein